MTGIVLVVAKAPAGGRSKTRLVPPLSVEDAASLHEALLLDTVEACRRVSGDVRILYAKEGDREPLERLVPGVRLIRQEGQGLADALRLGVARHFAEGPVAIVSSDLPGLPEGALAAAFAALADGVDVVLGPAHDGGYWLIGMRDADDRPFADIPWSTPAVCAVTRSRCEDAGLRVVELAPWRDIDTLVDLSLSLHEGIPLEAQATANVLRRIAHLIPSAPPLEMLSSDLIAASPWRTHLADRLRWEGRETSYTYVGVPRAVFVAAVTTADEVLLVRQYRHPVRDWTLEVPAGSVADGESALEAAQRELREEAGGVTSNWHHLSTFFSSSAHLSLRSDAWLATDVTLGTPDPDEDEAMTLVRMPLEIALETARRGGFTEGQTALTVLLAAERLEKLRQERNPCQES